MPRKGEGEMRRGLTSIPFNGYVLCSHVFCQQVLNRVDPVGHFLLFFGHLLCHLLGLLRVLKSRRCVSFGPLSVGCIDDPSVAERRTQMSLMKVRLCRFTHQLCACHVDPPKALQESLSIFVSHHDSLGTPQNFTCRL